MSQRQYGPYQNLILETPNASSAWSWWFRDVTRLLNEIAGSPVGYRLLRQVRSSSRQMTIVPRQVATSDANYCNATAGAEDWQAATPDDSLVLSCGGPRTGDPVRYRHPVQEWLGLEDWYDQYRTGTGSGSDTSIDFNPTAWSSSACGSGPGSNGDEILFHEMVHGLRQMKGIAWCLAARGGYDTYEEFVAILVTNIYTSSKTQSMSGLRADHHSFSALADPQNFLTAHVRNRTMTQRFRRDMPGLFNALRALDSAAVPFNPCRDLA